MSVNARRDSAPFAYQCHRCGQCCTTWRVRLNPYEALRLALHFGLTTTEFRAQHLEEDGATLQHLPHGCTFLTATGCAAHPARPAACRLYPLGRIERAAPGGGVDAFYLDLPPAEGSQGVYAPAPGAPSDTTIAGYLQSQEVGPYLEAARAYQDFWRDLKAALSKPRVQRALQALNPALLMDIHAALDRASQPPPPDPLDAARAHIALLRRWLGV